MTPLHLVLAHVTAANRPGSHAAVLVREIARLREALSRATEAAAAIADTYETENFLLAQDTILTDPVLRDRDMSPGALAVSERLQSDGLVHASMAHAARNIAEAIRAAGRDGGDV